MTQNRQYHRTTSRRDKFDKNEEKSAFVPRHIALQFMAIKGVTDVKPDTNTPERIDVVLLVDQPYNVELQSKIIQVEWAIKEALRPKQKFQASISWQ